MNHEGLTQFLLLMYIISSLSQVLHTVKVITEGLVGHYGASPFLFLISNLFTTQRQKDHITRFDLFK